MKYLFFALMIVSASAYSQNSNTQKLGRITNLKKLVFASCNKHNRPQTLWKKISAEAPDLFMWGGDNVYADGKGVQEILSAYQKQNTAVDYLKLKSTTPIIGIWDDHDYGKNNGGFDYKDKELSKQYALDFLEEPKNSPRRSRDGLYTSYVFGEGKQKIKMLLLDNRYNKDIQKGSLLGETQWQWLEKELKNSDAGLFVLVSGISVLTPKTIHSEEWADYPEEQLRLKKLLKSTMKPYLYLAGDRHFSDIYTKGDELEFLSSGMTHNTEAVVRPYVRKFYPSPIFKHNFGKLQFDWVGDDPELKLSIHDEDGKIYNATTARWYKTEWLLSRPR